MRFVNNDEQWLFSFEKWVFTDGETLVFSFC